MPRVDEIAQRADYRGLSRTVSSFPQSSINRRSSMAFGPEAARVLNPQSVVLTAISFTANACSPIYESVPCASGAPELLHLLDREGSLAHWSYDATGGGGVDLDPYIGM